MSMQRAAVLLGERVGSRLERSGDSDTSGSGVGGLAQTLQRSEGCARRERDKVGVGRRSSHSVFFVFVALCLLPFFSVDHFVSIAVGHLSVQIPIRLLTAYIVVVNTVCLIFSPGVVNLFCLPFFPPSSSLPPFLPHYAHVLHSLPLQTPPLIVSVPLSVHAAGALFPCGARLVQVRTRQYVRWGIQERPASRAR
jgi:hypothetical protein